MVSAAELKKQKQVIKNSIAHLETEHRKANVSDDSYKELKAKYTEQLKELDNTITDEEIQQDNTQPLQETVETKKNGGDFFGKILGKKSESIHGAETATIEATEETESQTTEDNSQSSEKLSIDIEKLKVMIDAIRESKKATDETLQTVFEGLGEMRSLTFQTDAAVKEITLKLDKLEEDVSEIKPQEIVKKFRETNNILEKFQIENEKLNKKTGDLSTKINQVHDMLKAIGGIENLITLNKDIKGKVDDVREAVRYIERLASKTEKIFIDLSKGLQDLTVYRVKQESLDTAITDILKNIDTLNLRFDSYATKKDIEDFKGEILTLQKDIEEMHKSIGIVSSNLPESIMTLKKEREDIKLFIESLEEQRRRKKISASDYEMIRRRNHKKIKEIDECLRIEWQNFLTAMKTTKTSGSAIKKNETTQEPSAVTESLFSPEISPDIKNKPPEPQIIEISNTSSGVNIKTSDETLSENDNKKGGASQNDNNTTKVPNKEQSIKSLVRQISHPESSEKENKYEDNIKNKTPENKFGKIGRFMHRKKRGKDAVKRLQQLKEKM